MKNINLLSNGKNVNEVLTQLTTSAATKELETITFVDEQGKETSLGVKYDFKQTEATTQLKNFKIEVLGVVSNVGTGKKTYLICTRKNEDGQNVCAFGSIEDIRKTYKIEYNVKAPKLFKDFEASLRNFIIANGLEIGEIFTDEAKQKFADFDKAHTSDKPTPKQEFALNILLGLGLTREEAIQKVLEQQ